MTANPGLRRNLLAAALVAALFAGVYWFRRPVTPPNAVAIVPARWTFLDTAGLDPADESLAAAVAATAAERARVPLVPWSAILPFRQKPTVSTTLARNVNAAMVLALSVRKSSDQYRITAFLAEPATGRGRWAEDFYAQDLAAPGAIAKLAETIAIDLELTLGYHH
jgi:nucleotide-binding universal stress UspA family protein